MKPYWPHIKLSSCKSHLWAALLLVGLLAGFNGSGQSVSYLWSTGDTTQTLNVTPSVTTTYTVTVTKYGLPTVDSFTVVVNSADTTFINVSICAGDSFTTAGGLVVYASGTYTDTLTSSAGCDSIVVASVAVNALPFISLAQDTILSCGEDSVQLDAGYGFASYAWSNGDTAQITYASSSAMYKITVTNSGGCSAEDSVFVSVINAQIQQDDTTICVGDTLSLSMSVQSSGSLSGSLNQGLVAWWPFNGNANDESGNGNDGTVNGATLTSDRFGNANSAYEFTVSGSASWGSEQQFIDVPYNTSFNSNQITCVGWVYPRHKPAPYNNRPLSVFSRWNDNMPNFRFQIEYTNELHFQLNDNTGTSHTTLAGNVPFDQWSFVAGTYDGNEYKLYVNGTLVHSEILGVQLMQGASSLTIAQTKMPNGNWYFFDGMLDNLGYWGRALTAGEIQSLFNGAVSYTWSTGDTTASISVSPTQTTTYYVTVTDGVGSCTDSVTVNVSSNPAISASVTPTDCEASQNGEIITSVSGGTSPYAYNWTNAATSANISSLGVGSYGVTVSDSIGCSSDSIFSITAYDSINPIASANNLDLYLNAAGNASFNFAQANNGSSDNCGIASYWFSDTAFSCADTGNNGVLMVVIDSTSNTDTVLFSVSVSDTTSPTVITQNITAYLNSSGVVSITAAQIDNGSSDNCAVDSMFIDINSFSCADIGANNVTLTVVDASGNAGSANAVVTIFDTISPVAVTQNITAYLDSNGTVSITAAQVDNGSSDNCAVDSMFIDINSFSCADTGANNVTLTVMDASGNVASSGVVVTIFDTISPVAVTQNITAYLDSNGTVSITAAQVDNGSSDNCAVDSMFLDINSFSCADIGANYIILTAVDASGNAGSANAVVTIVDTISPLAVAQNITAYLDSNGTVSITAAQVDNGSSDNCAVDSMFLDINSFSCADTGANNVTLTVMDASGNVASSGAVVTIFDTISPVAVAQNITAYLDSNGAVYITANEIDSGSADNCAIDTMYLDTTFFDCSGLGIHQVMLSVVDYFGNTTIDSAQVLVVDTLKPQISLPDSIVAVSDSDQCGTIVGFEPAFAFDNCSIDTIFHIDTLGLDSGDFFPVGFSVLTYVAIDQSGNSDTASFSVEVRDTMAPVFTVVPADTQICDSIFNFSLPLYSDNCTNISVIQIAGIASGQYYPIGLTQNIFVVIDLYGNSDTCAFAVTRFELPSLATVGGDLALCDSNQSVVQGSTPIIGVGLWTSTTSSAFFDSDTLDTTIVRSLNYGPNVIIWTITNGACPPSADTLVIDVVPDTAVSICESDFSLCDSNSSNIQAVPANLGWGNWTSISSSDSIFNPSAFATRVNGLAVGANTYIWSVYNGPCPVKHDTLTLTVSQSPQVIASDDFYVAPNTKVNLVAHSKQKLSYLWYPEEEIEDNNKSHAFVKPQSTSTYWVIGTNKYGCYGTDTVSVFVSMPFDIPTAFTPDGDKINDHWLIKELINYPGCMVNIYNRWGDLVYESRGYKTPWDGNYKGEPLPSGVYYYVIDIKQPNQPKLTGSIVLVR